MPDNVITLNAGRKPIRATKFVWRDPSLIPTRKFLFGRHYIRKFVSATVSPGGVGKSSLILTEALSMATGERLLNAKSRQPFKVWYWNGEDPYDELERRVAGVVLQHSLFADQFEGQLFIDSGRDSPIKLAEETRDGARIATIAFDELEAAIKEEGIDCLILDPLISAHAISENDNSAVGAMIKGLGTLADRCDIAIEAVHHVRKSRDDVEVQAEDARGASALVDGCRSVRTLTRMPKDQAAEYGLDNTARKSLFYVSYGKANLGPPVDPDWFRLEGIGLGNATEDDVEDNVGVVLPWSPPSSFRGITNLDVIHMQAEIDKGNYRGSVQATDWIGIVVARCMRLNIGDEGDKKRVKTMIAAWLKSGLLIETNEQDDKRRMRVFVRTGLRMEDIENETRS